MGMTDREREAYDRWLESSARTCETFSRLRTAANNATVQIEALAYAMYEWPDMVIEDVLDAEFIVDADEE